MNKNIFSKYDIILHIGLQRTGTTFLQQNVFSKIKNINYIDPDNKKFFYSFNNMETEKHRSYVENKLTKDKINLISEENINCGMFSSKDKRFSRLSRLKYFFPNARILFGIRNKEDLLVSWYVKYIMVGGIYNFDEFIKKITNINKLDHEQYIKKLNKYWGEKNIFVYKYEKLKTEPDEFVKDICDFIGTKPVKYQNIKKNRGYSLNQLKISMYLNRLFKNQHNPNGIIPLNYLYYPHRILFQSKVFSMIPKKKITINDLKQIN